MKTLGKYFLQGLVVLIPVLVSVYVVYAVFVNVDGLLGIPVPGVGFLLTLFLIAVIGFLANNFLTRWIFNLPEKLFTKLPLVKILYTSVRDLINAFAGEKRSFNKPVLVTFLEGGEGGKGGAKTIGFITREDLKFLGLSGHLAVYLPQSYNFAGNLFVVPAESVQPLEADSSEVMAFIVSGGVSGSKD